MTKNVNSGSKAYELATRLLDEWLGDRTEVGANDAWAALDQAVLRAPPHEAPQSLVRQITDGSGPELISRLLRRAGFRKVGTVGGALTYNRQALYRKAT